MNIYDKTKSCHGRAIPKIFFVLSWIIGDGPIVLPINDETKYHHKNSSLNNTRFHHISHALLYLPIYDVLL